MQLPKIYSQNDPAWKTEILGTKGTIGAYGCLMTCATMTCCYFNHNETPHTLNERLKANGGYSNGNLFVWSVLTKIFPDVKWVGSVTQTPAELTTAQMNTIRDTIDKGYPVFLKIDTIPATSSLDEHWILAYDYEGDDFMVADPWDGAKKRITSWGVKPQKLIWGYSHYSGTPAENTADALTECLRQHTELVTELDTAKKELATAGQNINLCQTEKNSLALQLQECQKQSEIYMAGYDKLPGMTAERDELLRQKAIWVETEKSYNMKLGKCKNQLDLIKSPIKNILLQILNELKK